MSMPARPTSIGSDVRAIFDRPYTTRILLVVLLSTLAFTCIDYVFKAAVARRVESAQLGVFFANVYLVLNAIALAIQLGCVSLLLRTLGVQRTAQVLPSFLLLAAGGVVAGGGLVAALLLKGADGVLRHSLHRTSTELMFVPLEDRVRSRIKPVIDLMGQRGGQALASLGILGLVSLGGTEIALGAAVVALTLGWIWVSAGIQRHYLNLFRDNLRAGRLDYHGDLPELDLHALEALFGALNSDRDAEVLAALELLSLQKKQRLIPALLLYHPSRRVVLQTLQVFVSEGRTDFTPIAQRLLSHPEPEVRAAALRAWAAVARDEAVLADLLQDPDLEVRATALVSLVSTGLMSDEETTPAIAALAEDPAPAVRIALARAMGEQPHARFEPVLERLAGASEPEVRSEVAWAMGRSQNPRFLPILLAFLEYRLESNAAQAACVAIGAPALEMLDATMGDPTASGRVRRNIPRAIAQFEPEVAAPILLRHLRDTIDGMLRFRILLALRRLRSLEPGVELDPQILGSVMEASVRSALRSLAWRLTLENGASEVAARNTPVLALMIGLLRDRESHALSRLFRLLALRHPEENFERIQRGLAKADAKSRASSRELIEHLIETPLRDAVLALIEDLSDAERLVRAPAGYRAPPVAYPRLLELLIAAGDELGTLALHHAGELGVAIVGSPGRDDGPQGVLGRALASRGAQVGHAG
jgi:ATP:ADP antiporter, AAA family